MNIFKKIQRAEKLSKGLRSLYLHRTIRDIGWGFLGVFSTIFVYQQSGGLEGTLIYYGFVSFISVIFFPLYAKLYRYVSLNKLMATSTIFLIGYVVCFFIVDQYFGWVWWMVAILIFFNVINHFNYWVPYNVELASFMNKQHRGRQLSFLAIVISLTGIVLPLISAFVITNFGFAALFVMAVIVIGISAYPLFFVERKMVTYSFGYLESFKKIFNKKHWKTNISFIADGFQGWTDAIIWVVFMFMIVDGKYMTLGIVSAAIVLATCVLRFVIGEATDKYNKEKLMKWGGLPYFLGWIFKAMSVTGFHAFLAGTYHSVVGIFIRTPLDALTFEIAAGEGSYVDEFSLLREMVLIMGRFLLVVVALLVYETLGFVWIFVAAGIFSLFMRMLSKDEFFLARNY